MLRHGPLNRCSNLCASLSFLTTADSWRTSEDYSDLAISLITYHQQRYRTVVTGRPIFQIEYGHSLVDSRTTPKKITDWIGDSSMHGAILMLVGGPIKRGLKPVVVYSLAVFARPVCVSSTPPIITSAGA